MSDEPRPFLIAQQIDPLGNRNPRLNARLIASGRQRRDAVRNESVDAIAVLTERLIGAGP